MNKNNITEVKEIKQLATQLLDKPVLEQEDIHRLNKKLDILLAQFGVFKRYFKRLS
jgi:hypothetical protein